MEVTFFNQKITQPFVLLIIVLAFIQCTEESSGPESSQITVSATNAANNAYPNLDIVLSLNQQVIQQGVTSQTGTVNFNIIESGTYSIESSIPLVSTVETTNPQSFTIGEGDNKNIAIQIEPEQVAAILNFGETDLLGEVRNHAGAIPNFDTDLIYERNWQEAPIGALHPILAPDGHHVTLGEWKKAEGTMRAYCDGLTTQFSFDFSGLIPDGVYTLWAIPLSGQRKPVSFQKSDMIGTGSLGVPPGNEVPNNAQGEANMEVSVPGGALSLYGRLDGCILTGESGLVIVVNYHIDGRTYGPAPGPDHTEVGHLIFML